MYFKFDDCEELFLCIIWCGICLCRRRRRRRDCNIACLCSVMPSIYLLTIDHVFVKIKINEVTDK
jgi:hypothetical protein